MSKIQVYCVGLFGGFLLALLVLPILEVNYYVRVERPEKEEETGHKTTHGGEANGGE